MEELNNRLNNLTLNEDIIEVINECEYVKNCKSNKKKDFNSLSYLISIQLSQSDSIKLGIGIERVINDLIIKKNKNVKSIKQKNKKNCREKDHLFIDETKKTIYYAELKSNINLDTEKSKSTIKKCLKIEKELIEIYPDYTIIWQLVALRHVSTKDIPKAIINKYKDINENIIGLNEYFKRLNIEICLVEKEYINMLNMLVSKMFK